MFRYPYRSNPYEDAADNESYITQARHYRAHHSCDRCQQHEDRKYTLGAESLRQQSSRYLYDEVSIIEWSQYMPLYFFSPVEFSILNQFLNVFF